MIFRFFTLLFFIFLTLSVSADDNQYNYDDEPKEKKEKKKDSDKKKHDITDTKKGLDVGEGDLVDTKKGLDIGTGDLVNTKGMLFGTAFPNPEQLLMLKKKLAAELNGVQNYRIAHKKNSTLVSSRLQLSWEILKKKSEKKKRYSSLKVKDISDGRKKFLKEKIAECNQNIKQIEKKIDSIDSQLKKIVANGQITGGGNYFMNQVTAEQGVDIMDKFGNAKHRFKKGAKVKTRVSPVDSDNFFVVEFESGIYYAPRESFKIK